MTYYFLNKDKTYRPCDVLEWTYQMEHVDRCVGGDIIKEKFVSTVWLGLDHRINGGRPLLFETMVFEEHRAGHDIYCQRYSTWDEAVAGHEHAIQWVKRGCKDED